MSDVGTVFKQYEFSHGGKTWVLGRPTLAVERAYATSREKAELQAIERHANTMSRLSYAVSMEGWLTGASNNKYGWNTPGFLASINADEANQVHLLWCWIGEFYNEARAFAKQCDAGMVVSEKQVREMYSDPATKVQLRTILEEALKDPNPLPPSI